MIENFNPLLDHPFVWFLVMFSSLASTHSICLFSSFPSFLIFVIESNSSPQARSTQKIAAEVSNPRTFILPFPKRYPLHGEAEENVLFIPSSLQSERLVVDLGVGRETIGTYNYERLPQGKTGIIFSQFWLSAHGTQMSTVSLCDVPSIGTTNIQWGAK